VHAVYEELCKRNISATLPDQQAAIPPAHFYLCGWKNMIDEAKKRIVEMGYERKAVHLELYG